MTNQLIALLDGREVDTVHCKNARLSFVYNDAWRADAHAKNYALLLGRGGAVRLAPFYDLASILPYTTVDVQKAKLAMKISGESRLRNIGLRHWQKFAVDLRLQEDWLIERIRAMAASLPDHAATIQNELETAGLLHGTITRLARRLKARASSCQELLPGSDSAAG